MNLVYSYLVLINYFSNVSFIYMSVYSYNGSRYILHSFFKLFLNIYVKYANVHYFGGTSPSTRNIIFNAAKILNLVAGVFFASSPGTSSWSSDFALLLSLLGICCIFCHLLCCLYVYLYITFVNTLKYYDSMIPTGLFWWIVFLLYFWFLFFSTCIL